LAAPSWQLDSDPTGMWIGIPREQLQLLAQSQPSREGIKHVFSIDDVRHLQLSFEVDVRKRHRAAAPV
jgi:hypothetical protein